MEKRRGPEAIASRPGDGARLGGLTLDNCLTSARVSMAMARSSAPIAAPMRMPSDNGGDSGAIGEGYGDYWGASYSSTTTNGKTFHPEWAFSWDGHGADTWSLETNTAHVATSPNTISEYRYTGCL